MLTEWSMNKENDRMRLQLSNVIQGLSINVNSSVHFIQEVSSNMSPSYSRSVYHVMKAISFLPWHTLCENHTIKHSTT